MQGQNDTIIFVVVKIDVLTPGQLLFPQCDDVIACIEKLRFLSQLKWCEFKIEICLRSGSEAGQQKENILGRPWTED